jgi:hypothetical protein
MWFFYPMDAGAGTMLARECREPMERTAARQTERAAHIIKLHKELIVSPRTSLKKAIEIGKLLTEQKASLKHGAWLPWIQESLPFSQPTAFNYMKCYEHREQLLQESNLSEAYKLLAPPKPEEEVVSKVLDKFITA